MLAHELGHVKNRDILISAVVATLAGAITLIARMVYWGELFGGFGGGRSDNRRGGGIFSALAMMIVAPLAATLIQLAISRSREYEADATGAHITGNPQGSGAGAQQDRSMVEAHSHAGFALHGAHVHHAAPHSRRGLLQPLFHASAHPQAHRTADRKGFCLVVSRQLSVLERSLPRMREFA